MEEQWLGFALRQAARCAPHPAPDTLGSGGASTGYRLSLLFLESLPLFQAQDCSYDVRLGVTLYDDAAGCFFGPTAHSAAVQYDLRRSKGRQGFHLDLGCCLLLHTRANLGAGAASCVEGTGRPDAGAEPSASLFAVVEVVLVERSADGVVCGEYSAGWCAVPLRQDAPAGATAAGSGRAAAPRAQAAGSASPDKVPPMGVALCCRKPRRPTASELSAWPPASLPVRATSAASGWLTAAQPGGAGRLCVPVIAGSPRYLLLSRLLPLQQRLRSPPLLGDGTACRLHFELQQCPSAATWMPLVSENCLVSSLDFVPGLEPWGPAGKAGVNAWHAKAGARGMPIQQWPTRLRGPAHAATVSRVSVHLPAGFLDAVRRHDASRWRRAHGAASAGGASKAGGQRLALRDLAKRLVLRVSAHNGRRFVGPPCPCKPVAVEAVEGQRGKHRLVAAGGACVAWLPADRCVAVVLELVLEPPARGSGSEQQEQVIGWAAIMPFERSEGPGGLRLQPAEGVRQAALRSGPGRWLRQQPLLDWRRLIESTGRSGPDAPLVTCALQLAQDRGVWPPPAAPQLAHPVLSCRPGSGQRSMPGHGPEASTEQGRQLQRQDSEAGTLISVCISQHAPQPQAAPPARQPAAVEPLQAATQPPASLTCGSIRPLASVRTQVIAGQRSDDGWVAVFSGSPTAKLAGTRSWEAACGASAVEAAIAAAAAARCPVPEGEVTSDLTAEGDDALSTLEASLQLLAYEAPPLAATAQLPTAVHFTFRGFSEEPTVTGQMRLHAIGAEGCSPAGGQLFALLPRAVQPALDDAAAPAPPAVILPLLQAAQLQQVAQQLGEAELAAGLLRQQRLRVSRYLAERRLQVDVWDSNSMLQVGTLSVPLHSLLRHGMPEAEAVWRVPVENWCLGTSRQDADGGSTQLSAISLQGSFLVRLACKGHCLDLQAAGSVAGIGQRPACSSQRGRPLVLSTGSALEECESPTAAEVARQEGLAAESAPNRLRDRVADRAACRVQRLLHFQSHGCNKAPTGGAAVAPSEELVEQEVVRGVAEARERCKSGAILLKLQSQLPAVEVLVVAPGDAAAFEHGFVNHGSQQALFEVSCDTDTPCAGLGPPELVKDEAEWQGLSCGRTPAGQPAQGKPASWLPGAAVCFRLGPQESCRLRFKLSRKLADGTGDQRAGGALLAWHSIRVRRVKGSGHPGLPARAGSAEGEPAATIRVAAVLPAAPVAHRTLRLYCPAASGAVAHAVQLSALPGAPRSFASNALMAACSSTAVRAAVRDGQVLLSCQAPPPRSAVRALVALHGGSPGSSCPLEVWEVYVHGLPTVRLAAGLGCSSAARYLLPREAAASLGCQPTLSWPGCSELQALLQPARAEGGGGAVVTLRFEPAAVGRRELLLSVAGRELLLVCLQSSGAISRSFSVVLDRGQAASKKVRYRSPHRERRRFAPRSLSPQLLRIAAHSATFELDGGGAAAIKMTLSGDAAAAALSRGRALPPGQGLPEGCCEALVVLESAPVAGGGATRVEEVFRVLLSLA